MCRIRSRDIFNERFEMELPSNSSCKQGKHGVSSAQTSIQKTVKKFKQLYVAFVRPHLEFALTAWCP